MPIEAYSPKCGFTGKGTAALYRAIRDAVAALEDDRAHGPDVERLAEFLKDSEDAWIPAR